MTVKADDDIEIIPVNDPGTWSAFRWFYEYGFESDFSTQETQTYTTSGTNTLNGNFTFTGTFTGAFDATVRMAVDTLIGTELDNVDDILTGYTHYYLDKDEIQLTISPTDNATQQNNGFSFGCVYNAQSTSTSSEMTCTPTSGLAQTIILPDAEITFDSIDTLFNSVTNYSVALTLRNEGTVVGTLTGSFSGSVGGSGTVTLSGVYNETTTTTNNQKYSFTMPYTTRKTNFPAGGLTYSQKYRFSGSKDNPFCIYWMSNKRDLYSMSNIYKMNTKTGVGNNAVWIAKIIYGTQDLIVNGAEYSGSDYAWMDFDGNRYNVTNQIIYPLYVGYKNNMSDELYRFIYGSDRTIEKISDQMAADQQHHDEMMDTSDSTRIESDGNALIESADDKFGDLFFPLQHAIETANDLSNVQATGLIRLPAIFSDNQYWYLDLTQIEQKLPEAWTFIRSLCQLAVSMYLILGLYYLFFGKGDDTNDS